MRNTWEASIFLNEKELNRLKKLDGEKVVVNARQKQDFNVFQVFVWKLLKEPKIIIVSGLADNGVAFLFGRITRPEKLRLANMTIRKWRDNIY